VPRNDIRLSGFKLDLGLKSRIAFAAYMQLSYKLPEQPAFRPDHDDHHNPSLVPVYSSFEML
jgi:hypothetical protein